MVIQSLTLKAHALTIPNSIQQNQPLQLYHQQSIFQKYSKRVATFAEKYAKMLVRLPETKNLYKFTVERSMLNDNLYMCIAVPSEVILYLWFQPRNSFVQLKTVQASVPRTCPFSLIFDVGMFKEWIWGVNLECSDDKVVSM